MKKNKPKILVYNAADASKKTYHYLESLGCEVCILEESLSDERYYETFKVQAKGASAIIGNTFKHGRLSVDFFENTPNLRVITKYTIGTDEIDLALANQRGIIITNSPVEASWGGVAENVIAMMLSMLKKTVPRHLAVLNGDWRDQKLIGSYLGSRSDGFSGITLGIIGLGRVGSRLARLLSSWNFFIIACDPYVNSQQFIDLGVEEVSLTDLLKRSDVVSLNCSLTEETFNLINSDTIKQLKQGAVLINTARGQLIDEDALCQSIRSGLISQFAADVFCEEPLPPNSLLRGFDSAQVLLSPHMSAANYPGTLSAAIPVATDAVIDALRGRLPQNIINLEASQLWLKRFEGIDLICD
jgi:D-3-phosphoglycerate dehydrogenase / 2-oxoglutarate reductase